MTSQRQIGQNNNTRLTVLSKSLDKWFYGQKCRFLWSHYLTDPFFSHSISPEDMIASPTGNYLRHSRKWYNNAKPEGRTKAKRGVVLYHAHQGKRIMKSPFCKSCVLQWNPPFHSCYKMIHWTQSAKYSPVHWVVELVWPANGPKSTYFPNKCETLYCYNMFICNNNQCTIIWTNIVLLSLFAKHITEKYPRSGSPDLQRYRHMSRMQSNRDPLQRRCFKIYNKTSRYCS